MVRKTNAPPCDWGAPGASSSFETRARPLQFADPFRKSLPGSTRQSIHLRNNLFAKKMDGRVKPAHDEIPTHDVKQPISFPRRVFAPGF